MPLPRRLMLRADDTPGAPALRLPFSGLRDSTTSDGRAAGWWNLFNGGTTEPDVFIDGTTGALTYGAHNFAAASAGPFTSPWFVNATGTDLGAGGLIDGNATRRLSGRGFYQSDRKSVV